jgi:hypothetical protein
MYSNLFMKFQSEEKYYKIIIHEPILLIEQSVHPQLKPQQFIYLFVAILVLNYVLNYLVYLIFLLFTLD